jgi:hypothetical protein
MLLKCLLGRPERLPIIMNIRTVMRTKVTIATTTTAAVPTTTTTTRATCKNVKEEEDSVITIMIMSTTILYKRLQQPRRGARFTATCPLSFQVTGMAA